MERITLLLGSNQGDRERYLELAIENIGAEIGNICSLSNVYQSKAVGYESPNDYLNQALTLQTTLTPEELLERTQLIEKRLDRVRSQTERYTDRTIDIDILFYGDTLVSTATLTIPHPEIGNREFVLRPLMDIIPEYRHPISGETIEQMAKKLNYFCFDG